ncbi:hypothetical protein WN944_023626 [Citrus x changshan-huyou]|uniref:Uncharacterized protein n=1 Tax=Citrus x changshan-huyou TaxID=2935761 RepID=A0AAP0R1C2_9ROSI
MGIICRSKLHDDKPLFLDYQQLQPKQSKSLLPTSGNLWKKQLQYVEYVLDVPTQKLRGMGTTSLQVGLVNAKATAEQICFVWWASKSRPHGTGLERVARSGVNRPSDMQRRRGLSLMNIFIPFHYATQREAGLYGSIRASLPEGESEPFACVTFLDHGPCKEKLV